MNTYRIVFDFEGTTHSVYCTAERLGNIFGQHFLSEEEATYTGLFFKHKGKNYFAKFIIDDNSLEIYPAGTGVDEDVLDTPSYKIERIHIID